MHITLFSVPLLGLLCSTVSALPPIREQPALPPPVHSPAAHIPGPPRRITVITDVSGENPATYNAHTVHGAHSFLAIDPTPLDPPMLLSLVALVVDDLPAGLAVSVRTIPTARTAQAGHPDYPTVPAASSRVTSDLGFATRLRNRDIFDPLLSSSSSAGPVLDAFVLNALQSALPPGISPYGLFGTSHEFVHALLATAALQPPAGAEVTLDAALTERMSDAEHWATMLRRDRPLGYDYARGGLASWKDVEWIVYEAEEASGDVRRSLYGLDHQEGAKLGVKRVVLAGLDGLVPSGEEGERKENGRLVLSRECHLTSDALPFPERSQFLLEMIDKARKRKDGARAEDAEGGAAKWRCWIGRLLRKSACAGGAGAVLP